ncbi:glycosyltransferase family 2 protein [Sulfurimonas sp.]|uniref:glycosyltransferase family 2 protein n=1 Tax=Sulfurimonas sp. TaxID=2022749 RepID=UPI002B49BB71|nr:glycosyltransferase family 2 protein [Sulfurimonas sp.]
MKNISNYEKKKIIENKPLVSIVTVVFNGEKYLEETILSVINQTYMNVEYIIIDGGSTDETVDIIKKYENKIDYWVSEKDAGIYDAMNKGIDLVNGDWINFMNAGDVFYDITTIKKIFQNNLHANINFIYGNLDINYESFNKTKKALSLEYFWKGMPFSHQSVFINSSFHKLNKYNLDYKIASDFHLFYNSYQKKNKFYYINKTISVVLFGGLSDNNHLQVLEENYQIIKDNNFKTKYYIYYHYMHIIVRLKNFIKLILGNKLSSLVKKIK